jgi:hypothetical protein
MLPAMLPRRSSSHELQLQRECEMLQLKLLKANSELRTKTVYAQRLEYLVHERDERVDELNALLDQSRQQVRRLDLQNEILIEMIASPPLDAAMLVPK